MTPLPQPILIKTKKQKIQLKERRLKFIHKMIINNNTILMNNITNNFRIVSFKTRITMCKIFIKTYKFMKKNNNLDFKISLS